MFSFRLVALTSLAAIWFAGPARAQLTVSAPTPPQARQLESWYEHHIPLRFRADSPLAIRELTDAEMDSYLKGAQSGDQDNSAANDDDDMGDIDGVFESDPDRMSLRLPAEGDPDVFTFAHEYGHYVWFHLLSKDDRHRYEAIYKHQLAAHHLVTRYAATDLEEGFAEAFSFYACEPQMLAHRDAASFQYLNQWDAAGKPATEKPATDD